jgi:P27 family predicted phage terminase small subunit
MNRGRKPVPTVVKKLHGTLKPCRAKSEPVAPAGSLVPGSQIDGFPYARAFWDHYAATAPYGMLKPVDVPLLELLCLALARARIAEEHLQADGMVVENKAGNQVSNQYLTIARQQAEIARRLASELGLPVTGRARMDMPASDSVPDSDGRALRPAVESFDAFLASNPQKQRPH